MQAKWRTVMNERSRTNSNDNDENAHENDESTARRKDSTMQKRLHYTNAETGRTMLYGAFSELACCYVVKKTRFTLYGGKNLER